MIFLEIGVVVVMQSSLWYSGCVWETGARPYSTRYVRARGERILSNKVTECFDCQAWIDDDNITPSMMLLRPSPEISYKQLPVSRQHSAQVGYTYCLCSLYSSACCYYR